MIIKNELKKRRGGIKVFQNIQEDRESNTKEETNKKKNILTNAISKKYIILYILTIMVSTIGMGQAISPASIAMVAAVGANEIPIIIVLILGLIGNIIGCGVGSILTYIVTMLIFFASFFVTEPKYNDESRNEKIKYGKRIFIASLIVGVVKVLISGFLLYDFLVAITMSMLTFVLYKIFVNSITVVLDFTERRAFSLEEIMGASILLTIAACSLGGLQIFGFSIRNIIAIFIVLFLGWKNGMLVGATSGITIGVTLGIIAETEPVAIAAYAISGLVAGILNKFGKIGVIVGFVLGNVILTYLTNGGIENLILFREILIAGIGLLAVPKNIKLDIENIIGNKQFLPVGVNRGLNRSKETIEKLKDVSKAVEEMANTYNDATRDDEIEIKNKNKQIFIAELLNSIDNLEDNILYDNISETQGKIVNDIFEKLLEKQFIKEKDLLEIFANNNNYIVGFEDEDRTVKREVEKMTQTINSAYRISKMNFIFNNKLKEEKKNVGSQLNGVSKAISKLADDIKNDMKEEINNNGLYAKEKEAIAALLKQKEILVQEISMNKKDNGRFSVELYIEHNKNKDITEIILNILEKNLNEKFRMIERKIVENEAKYILESDDKYNLEIGQAIAIKDGNTVSGDSILHTKLKDGKYLLVISDGMGSGPEARKSSQIVVNMLKRLLDSGFNKETSIDLINSNLLNVGEDVYATLDMAIVDLYKGNIEFVKAGCSPTYIKNKKKVQLIKSASLPTGIVKNISKQVLERKIEDGDLVFSCSDGVIDSTVEYKNKSLWIKYLLEDMENTNPQKIADIILNEAVDNNFGKVKDDMSILVYKLIKR